MRDYFISIFYSEEDGGYIADIPDLRFCSAFGETPEEALREVQIAKALWLETATIKIYHEDTKDTKGYISFLRPLDPLPALNGLDFPQVFVNFVPLW